MRPQRAQQQPLPRLACVAAVASACSSPPPAPVAAPRPPLWRQNRRATLPTNLAAGQHRDQQQQQQTTPPSLAAAASELWQHRRRCSCMSHMGAACSVHTESSKAGLVTSIGPAAAANANRRATATMDDGQFHPAASASSAGQGVASQGGSNGGVALRQVGLNVEGEEGHRVHAEHSRSFSQGSSCSSSSRSSTSVQAWKSKVAAESTTTPTQPKRSLVLPGLAPAASSSTASNAGLASPTNVDPVASRTASSCASRLSNRSSGGSGTEDHASLLPSAAMRLQGPVGASAAVSPLEDSASSEGASTEFPKEFPVVVTVIRSAETKQRRAALVASGRNQSPFAAHARTASASVVRADTTTPPISGASTNSNPASASVIVGPKSNVPAQVASAPSHTRRLNPALVERAHLGVHGGGASVTHSRKSSLANGSCMVGADEVPLGYTHAADPSPGSSTVASAASSVALVAAAAPTLGADVVSAETTRSLNAYLAAPKLMTAEEYRSTYPAFDAHNADYMAYRARWEAAEREATASAQNAPGSRPHASSRSLLCTPKNAPRSISAAATPGSGASVQSSPLSALRVLTPTLHGAFGYGALSPDDPLAAGVTASPLQSPSASLYLPPPSFVDGEVPTDFVHKHSVMAFMVESSRPSSLRATPLKGFVSVGASGGSRAGSLVGTPMTTNKRLLIGDGSSPSALLSPGLASDSELLLPSPQASSSSPDASLVFRELLVTKSDALTAGDSTPCSPLAGSFKPKLFTSSMQAQKSPLLTSALTTVHDAFVPVLPSSHVIEEPVMADAPSAAVSSAPSAAAISAAASAMIGGPRIVIRSGGGGGGEKSVASSAATAPTASVEARRCFSDGIATRRLNAAQLELQKRMLSGSEDGSCSTISPVTASPVAASVAGTTQSASVASTVRISSRRHISAGGSRSPSLPGTPLEAEDLTTLGAPVSVSAAVLRSQAHISAITKSWQDRLSSGGAVGGVGGEAGASSDGGIHLPHVILDRSSPSHSRAASQSSVNSPRLSEDPRYAAASASVARKLAMPAATRLRAIKCMLPSDRAMTESTPVSLPPAHSPAAAINKRRLHLSSGGVVSSPLSAADGVNSPLPTPSPTAAAAAAAAPSCSSGSSSGLSLAPSVATPSPTTRRRLLLQVPATSSPIAPHSSASAGGAGGGGSSVYSFAQMSSATLPAIASATSLSSWHSAEPRSASYSCSSSSSSTLSSPVGSANTTPSSSHRRMFSAGGGAGLTTHAAGSGRA